MNKVPEHLPIHMVLQLANAACEKYGFQKLISAELTPMYITKRDVLPVVRRTARGILWVDKWYVAVQLGDGAVRYLYVTRHHINEELASYRVLKKERAHPAELPDEILQQFRIAYRWMKPVEQKFYFSKAAEALGLGWVNGWRSSIRKELEERLYKVPSEERSA